MNNLITELTPYIIGILGVLLTYLGRKLNLFLNERIDKDQYNMIKDVVKGAVMFVEQISKIDVSLQGEIKFNLAKEKSLVILADKGLSITEEELEILIEAFVLEIKGVK